MGRTQLVHKFEITQEYKELQELAMKITFRGGKVTVDPIAETVTFLNGQVMNYKDGKAKILELLDIAANSIGGSELVPIPVEQLNKKVKKPRAPGAPPELKALLRRSKRIYKKSVLKGISSADASLKATQYIERKAKDDNDKNIAASQLLNYIAKEMA